MAPQFLVAPPLSESLRLIFIAALLIFLFFLAKWKKFVYAIFILYLNIANLLIVHVYLHWGYNGGLTNRFGVALESPTSETLEYLNSYLDFRDFLLLIYTSLVYILLYVFLKHYRHSFKIIKYIGLTIAVSILFVLSVFKNPFKIDPLGIPWEYYQAKRYLIYPKERASYLKNLPAKHKVYKGLYSKIVIIQGESVNKNHMSLYGYKYTTTPFFDQRINKKSFYKFNAISPANQTRLSVPLMNTPARVGNFMEPYMHSRSLVGDFGGSGFKTYWISGQRSFGMTNATIGSLGMEADERYYANLEGKNSTDIILVDHLKKIGFQAGREMYFFHLIGSHFEYEKRYTSDKSLFSNPKNIIEKYDNSIFYTDFILQQIITYFENMYKKENILFVYSSDHGEVVDKKRYGHGFVPPFKEEFEVPFIIYSSCNNPRIDQINEMNKKNMINLESLFDIVEYVAGLKDNINISFSTKVNCLEPEAIYDYKKLHYDNDK